MTASLPCSVSCSANTCPFAASCHGRKTTSASPTALTSAEKSLASWLTESRRTVTFASSSAAVAVSASPVLYELWSSTMKTSCASSSSAMKVAIVGPWASSFGTTRANVGYLPLVRAVAADDGEDLVVRHEPLGDRRRLRRVELRVALHGLEAGVVLLVVALHRVLGEVELLDADRRRVARDRRHHADRARALRRRRRGRGRLVLVVFAA